MAFLRKSRWEQAKEDVKKEIFDPIDKDGSGSLDAKEVEYLFSEVGVGAIFAKFADLSKVGGVKEAISAAKKETEDAEMSAIEREMSAKLFNNLTFSILCHSPPSRLFLLVYTEHLILIY